MTRTFWTGGWWQSIVLRKTSCEEIRRTPGRLVCRVGGVAFKGPKDIGIPPRPFSFVCVLSLLLCPPIPLLPSLSIISIMPNSTAMRSSLLSASACRSIFTKQNVAIVSGCHTHCNVLTYFGMPIKLFQFRIWPRPLPLFVGNKDLTKFRKLHRRPRTTFLSQNKNQAWLTLSEYSHCWSKLVSIVDVEQLRVFVIVRRCTSLSRPPSSSSSSFSLRWLTPNRPLDNFTPTAVKSRPTARPPANPPIRIAKFDDFLYVCDVGCSSCG